jgi:hypothetical protein
MMLDLIDIIAKRICKDVYPHNEYKSLRKTSKAVIKLVRKHDQDVEKIVREALR